MLWRILSVFNLLKRVGFALLLLGGVILAQAQPPDTLWTRRYGRQYHDIAHSVAQTPDGGFIIAGETWNAEVFETRNADAYVVKIDSLGNEEWSHSWGTGYSERINKIIALEDGYIAAGAYETFPPSPPQPSFGWLLRLNAQGDTLWTRVIPEDNGYAWFEDMILTDDGHVVCFGESNFSSSRDFWMVKFDIDGNTIWTRSFGGSAWEHGWAITQATDGGYVACGYTSSFGAGSYDFWLIKVSPDGDSLWSRTFGFGGPEEARAIALAQDGGFFLGGYSGSLSQTYDDAWIVRTDSMGNYLWDKDLAGEFALGIEALVALDDGSVIATGGDNPGSGGTALYMAKVDSAGDSVWARSWFRDWTSYGRDLIQLPDGSFVAVGGAGSHGDPAHQTGDMWFIRLSPDMSPVSPTGPYLPTQMEMSVFPNPFNSSTEISFEMPRAAHATIKVYDVLGREQATLLDDVVQGGTRRVMWNAEGFASGIYFVRLSVGDVAVTKKVALIK